MIDGETNTYLDMNSIDDDEWLPENVLKQDWLNIYNLRIDAIWWQLVRLNSNIFILKKIRDFPFEPLGLYGGELHFWDLIYASLIESSVLIITKIGGIDKDADVLTIPKLGDDIYKNLRSQSLKIKFGRLRKIAEPKRQLNPIRRKIEDLRNNSIAHLNRDWNTILNQAERNSRRVFISEVEAICNDINGEFSMLCLGLGRSVLPIEYDPNVEYPAGMDSRSDIEIILDSIARDSDVLNMPEKQKDFWPYYKRKFSQNDIDQLNHYRRKFGLPII